MLNGKMGFKEKCEQKASEYADIVARGGVGVTYNEAYEYYMKKYLPTYYCLNCGSKLGLDCGEAEADYNEDFCSVGCASEMKRNGATNAKTH